ncbi:hypothetical protein Gpo141_00002063 [Globisporangium polare]
MANLRQRMLYFITPSVGRRVAPTDLARIVEQAIQGGAGLIQWRQKPSTADLLADAQLSREWESSKGVKPFLLEIAKEIRHITKKYGVPFIVNDSLELALEVDADGVHVGQADATLTQLQQKLRAKGKDLIIGVTVRDGIQAKAACEGGATYLGAGPVFTSSSKPLANDGNTIGIDGLRACSQVAQLFNVPVYAIGGLSLKDRSIQRCIEEGNAAGVSVIAAIGGAADVKSAAAAINSELVKTAQSLQKY